MSRATRDFAAVLRDRVVPPGSTRWAVVIGINDHPVEALKLRYAREDAMAIHRILTDPDCGLVPMENARLLLDAEATFANVREALLGLTEVGSGDSVWIYYSGHAGPCGDRHYWVTHDATMDNLRKRGYSNEDFLRVISEIPAARTVVLLDCCYAVAATMAKNRVKAVQTAEAMLASFEGEGRLILASSNRDEKSVESASLERGCFTHFLERGLRGEADADDDGVVTADELWSYLDRKVTEAARQAGVKQRPVRKGEMTHELALTLNPVAAVKNRAVADLLWASVSASGLRHDQAEFCIELLRCPPREPHLVALVEDMRKFARGEMTLAQFKRIIELTMGRSPSHPPLPPPKASPLPVVVTDPVSEPPMAEALPLPETKPWELVCWSQLALAVEDGLFDLSGGRLGRKLLPVLWTEEGFRWLEVQPEDRRAPLLPRGVEQAARFGPGCRPANGLSWYDAVAFCNWATLHRHGRYLLADHPADLVAYHPDGEIHLDRGIRLPTWSEMDQHWREGKLPLSPEMAAEGSWEWLTDRFLPDHLRKGSVVGRNNGAMDRARYVHGPVPRPLRGSAGKEMTERGARIGGYFRCVIPGEEPLP